jgi:chitodextrinase
MNFLQSLKSLATPMVAMLALAACQAQPVSAPGIQSPISSTLNSPSQAATLQVSPTVTPGTLSTSIQQLAPASTQENTQVSNSGSVQISKCSVSSPTSRSYTVTVCISKPSNNSVLTGNATITAALTASGNSPGVQRFVYYLNDTYLLTDFQSPYTFTLPTRNWADGVYILSAEALMRDGFVSSRANIYVQVKNGAVATSTGQNSFQPTSGTQPQKGQPFIVVAAGDGASGEASSQKVSDLIASLNPNLFLYLGDVYENGSLAEFYNWYGNQGSYFDRFRSITDPTVGNHEYSQQDAQGYFTYWNNIPNYYSFNAGGWHFISLNANASHVPTGNNSAQYQWLEKDLAANVNTCTIVYYHQPLFNIGAEGSDSAMSDHDYQRWVPLDSNGQPSPSGITEFVAGGGGHGLQKLQNKDSRLAFSDDMNPDAFGVLELRLNSNGVNFSYVNEKNVVLDSGVIPCQKAKASQDSQPPASPPGLAATAVGATLVNLTWGTSTDNTGVSGYTIYRDGNELATVSGTSQTFSDETVIPQKTYSYTVDAFDLAGNHSAQSQAASVTTPTMPSNLTFSPDGDTYVNAASPVMNYGAAGTLRLDSSPDVHAYLRFKVKGLAGMSIARAMLQVYVKTASSLGFQVQSVADKTWDERTMNYGNAPPIGGVLATSGPVAANSWVTVDLSPYITSEGVYSFSLTTNNTSALSIASRESGANAAQLVVELTQ